MCNSITLDIVSNITTFNQSDDLIAKENRDAICLSHAKLNKLFITKPLSPYTFIENVS